MSELPEILPIMSIDFFDVYLSEPPVYPSIHFKNKEERDTYNKIALMDGYFNAVKLEQCEVIVHREARVICCGKGAYEALKNKCGRGDNERITRKSNSVEWMS